QVSDAKLPHQQKIKPCCWQPAFEECSGFRVLSHQHSGRSAPCGQRTQNYLATSRMTGINRPFCPDDRSEIRKASLSNASPSAKLRTPANTFTPSAASLSEVALPIPVEVPVTSTDRATEFFAV